MALVSSVYRYASESYFPELLLLDELDATLHPAMMRNMLDIIQSTFIARGTNVILVTHSPTTVALSREGSIVIMRKAGEDRFEKVSPNQALSILTEGFATLNEGMILYNQLAGYELSVVSEGRNRRLIKKACELYGENKVHFIDNLDNCTGKNQLKTLYDFMSRIPHQAKILFIWDCDASYNLTEENNTFCYFFPQNPTNEIAKSGIENMFCSDLTNGFQKRIIRSNGNEIIEFDESRKKDFENFVIDRSHKDDFIGFEPLIVRLREVRLLDRK